MASELTSVADGTNRRLIINLPPRHLKSFLSTIALPAWLLGRNPSAQIICVSYAQELADKFGRDCRQIMGSSWYRLMFPKTVLTAKKHASAEFETTAGGFRLATSTGGVLTGRGADFIIIDDPLKASDAFSEKAREGLNDWYGRTLFSRLNDKKRGSIIVVMQRLHEDDLSGVLLDRETFQHIRLAAIAPADESFEISTLFGPKTVGRKAGEALHPAREPVDLLLDFKRTVGESVFAAQYQQDPVPAEGNLVKTAWLRYYAPGDLPQEFDTVFQSWDTANKLTDGSDFSVCTTWGVHEKRLYLLHVLRDRMDFPTLRTRAMAHREAFDAKTVLIEDKASGMQLLQELHAKGMHQAKGIEPIGDKVFRMHGQTVLFENGAILLPREAPWLSDYLRELTAFPHSKHDDQIDSTSQALAWFNPRQAEPGMLTHLKQRLERSRADEPAI